MAADNENAEAVERALTRMDDLINQILTLAREGQPVEQWDAVSLSSVAKGLGDGRDGHCRITGR